MRRSLKIIWCLEIWSLLWINTFYLIICFLLKFFITDLSLSFLQLPLLGMWRWLTMCLSPFTLYDLWRFPGSSPISDLPQSYSTLPVAIFSFLFPYLHPLSVQSGLYTFPLWWPYIGLTSLISTLCLSSTLSFYASYIIDHMYIYVICL